MKKTGILVFLLIMCVLCHSQSIQDIKRCIDLEHYGKAQLLCEKIKNTEPEAACLLTEIFIQQGNLQEAKQTITASLQTFKDNTLLQVASAHLMLCEGNKTGAKAMFDQCISKAGNRKAGILIAIGKACGETPLRNSDPDYGIAQLQEALKLQPSAAIIHLYMGDCYCRKLDGGNALLHYEDAIKGDNKLAAIANYKIGNIYRTQDNCQSMTRYYTEAVKADPNFMPAWRALYNAYASRESNCYNAEKGETYYTSYIASAEPGLQTELVKISHLYHSKDYTAVLQKITDLQGQMGAKAPAYLYATAAMAYYQQKDYAGTISSFENYFNTEKSADNLQPVYYNTLASAYSETGQYQKAKDTYLKYAAIQADEAAKISTLYKAADEAHKAKDYNAEAAICKQVTDSKHKPTSADYYKLGTAWYNAQNYGECKKVFQRYSEAYPADWRSSLWIGNCEALIDSTMTTGAAIPYYEKFITLGTPDPQAKNSLIKTHMYLFAYEYQVKKNMTAAITHLDSVLALDPANADAQKYKKALGK